MKKSIIYPSEYQFCKILWKNEPIGSTNLVELCRKELTWSKSTTYTVIRRLSARRIIANHHAMCRSMVPQELIKKMLVTEFVNVYFDSDLSELEHCIQDLKNEE